MIPKCIASPTALTKYMRQYNLGVKGFILAQGFRGFYPEEHWVYGRAAHTVLEKNQKREYRNISPPLVLPLFYFLFYRVGVWLGGHIQSGNSAPQLLLSGNTHADIPPAVCLTISWVTQDSVELIKIMNCVREWQRKPGERWTHDNDFCMDFKARQNKTFIMASTQAKIKEKEKTCKEQENQIRNNSNSWDPWE